MPTEAKLVPGIIMGPCETLSASGFKFLLELGAPLVNQHGDRLAPLALALGTYGRNPAGKHAILQLFREQGYDLPDTPMMAFHRGDLVRLRAHLHEDPRLLDRRFMLREIYPPECGCPNEGRSGMHWTPIDGTTLLHLAIDFREREIFDWLLAEGIDVDARALIDGEGFGGHTALFNSSYGARAGMRRSLLPCSNAALPAMHAPACGNFLDWCEQPHWHEARNVTPAEWGAHVSGSRLGKSSSAGSVGDLAWCPTKKVRK